MRLLGIVNPRAAGGRPVRRLPALRKAFERSPHDVEWLVSASAGEARCHICNAADGGADGVVLVGGDGTVHEALPALRESGLPVGIIPLGRGNDFARNLGIRRERRSIGWWNEVPEVQELDLPTVNGSPFASVACLGFDAVVNGLAREREGYFDGTLGYVVCVLKALGAFQPFGVEVIVDGWRWSGDVMMVAVANGPCYGGGMRIAPRASMRDGQVDVCIVKAVSKPTLLRQFPRVYRGSHTSHPAVITVSGRTVSVTADRDQDLYADGERVGSAPAAVTLADQQLRVLVPASLTDTG